MKKVQLFLFILVLLAIPIRSHAQDVTTKKNEDGSQINIQVVNTSTTSIMTGISIHGFIPSRPTFEMVQIMADIDDVNTADEPEKIIPWSRNVYCRKPGSKQRININVVFIILPNE